MSEIKLEDKLGYDNYFSLDNGKFYIREDEKVISFEFMNTRDSLEKIADHLYDVASKLDKYCMCGCNAPVYRKGMCETCWRENHE